LLILYPTSYTHATGTLQVASQPFVQLCLEIASLQSTFAYNVVVIVWQAVFFSVIFR